MDTVDLIAEVMNVVADFKQTEERERPLRSEVDRLVACTQKARELIGWDPEFAGRAGLKKGLAQTAEWFQDPAILARYKNSAYNL